MEAVEPFKPLTKFSILLMSLALAAATVGGLTALGDLTGVMDLASLMTLSSCLGEGDLEGTALGGVGDLPPDESAGGDFDVDKRDEAEW